MDSSSLSLVSSFLGVNNDNNDENKMSTDASNNDTVNGNRCYMSLLTNDSYLPGASVLCKTVRRYNKYPIYIMVSKEVSETTCHRLSTICDGIIHVPSISSPYSNNNKTEEAASWENSEYTKLNLWNMCQFDKIVYIDLDAMIVTTTDELFDLDTDFAAAPDIFPPDKFNAGVLVIRPNADIFNSMLEKVHILPSYDGGDTGFLNAFFPNWYLGDCNTRLTFGYNAQRTMYWFTHSKRPGYWNSIQSLKIIHFSSSPKPWEAGTNLGELELLWWSCM